VTPTSGRTRTAPDANCLANKLRIRDPDGLASLEHEIVAMRNVEIARDTLPGAYDVEHLKAFHRRLFGDVYGWAGELRTVAITKGWSTFCLPAFLGEQLRGLFSRLESENYIRGLKTPGFVERLAYYYGELNAIHPFREGNGRTQRAFFFQLSASANHRLDWSRLDQAANNEACELSLLAGDATQLVKVLRPVILSR